MVSWINVRRRMTEMTRLKGAPCDPMTHDQSTHCLLCCTVYDTTISETLPKCTPTYADFNMIFRRFLRTLTRTS